MKHGGKKRNPRLSSSTAENKHVGSALLHVIGVVFEYGNFLKVWPPEFCWKTSCAVFVSSHVHPL